MQSLVRLLQPSLSLQYQPMITVVWVILCILPFALWHFTSDVISYFRYGAPTGQLWYVFSKLFALYAVLLLWYQAVSTLLKHTRYHGLLPKWSFLQHRIIGSLTLFTISIHIICFVVAVSLRKETIAWGLLLPDFRDFYHSAITVGLFAFAVVIFAVIAALLRAYFSNIWKNIHRCMILVVMLGLVHGYLIGTETRYGLYEVFYCSLMVTLLISAALYWRKNKVQFI